MRTVSPPTWENTETMFYSATGLSVAVVTLTNKEIQLKRRNYMKMTSVFPSANALLLRKANEPNSTLSAPEL